MVVSSHGDYTVDKRFSLASSPQDALEKLQKAGFTSVVLTGGSMLNSSFAKLQLIDEVIVNIEPIIVGKGIPLFDPALFDLKLELLEMKESKGYTIKLHYKVSK